SSSNIKRMLGFSSFSHSGMIVLLVVISKTELGTGMMLNAAVVMLIIHALSKFIMFFALRALSDDNGRINAGFASRPFAVFTFTIGALTLSGIPPFPMFYVKFRVLAELVRTGYLWVGIIILFATFIEILYLFKVIRKIFISKAEPSVPEHITAILPAAVILIIIFYLTLNPSIINRGTVMQDFRSEMQTARESASGPGQSRTVEGEHYND
ncbi:MAG: proton-conducting transporter membrane subunit, partial [candidate division WOR-3 bacterium]|nr:proton-conducting transporter membrane subunit [candidate division WOR-3 bacterium]